MPGDDGQRDDAAIEHAWKIHAALVDWTGKVDSKASFALTLESAILGAIAAFSTTERPLSGLTGGAVLAYRAGVAGLVLAALCAVAAVIPRVRFWQTLSEWERNVIFFGHTRHWKDAAALAKALRESDMLDVLVRQHMAMSKIAWSKHVWVQASLALAVVGAGLVAGAGVFGR